jgi:hypothetical protein
MFKICGTFGREPRKRSQLQNKHPENAFRAVRTDTKDFMGGWQ